MGPADIIFLISLLASPAIAADDVCHAPAPVLLPIGNTTISDTGVKRWGVKAQFGTPGQSLAPVLNAGWNNTSLWPPEIDCPKISRPGCAWLRGGSFDPSKSKSWNKSTETNIYEFIRPDAEKGISPWGEDTLSLEPNITLEQFPIYTASRGKVPESSLGLGRRSTLLEMLMEQKQIASRTWSLFWGWHGWEGSQRMEGNLVLGGYDKAKTAGKLNSTEVFSDDHRCPSSLLVNIKDITVNHVTGNKTSLFKAPGSTMQSCIKPDVPLMTFPEHVYNHFKRAMPGDYLGSSGGIYHSALSYAAEGSFAGNLTITLLSGVTITIPNHQLVIPNVGIHENDDSYNVDYIDDNKTVMVYDDAAGGMPVLGQPFLSSAYLYVDNELKQFTIWEAEVTDDVQLVTVEHTDGERSTCDTDAIQEPETTPSAAPDSGADNDDNNDDDYDDNDNGNGLSAGSIAGIVVGVVGAVAIICLVGFYFLRRHWQVKSMKERAHHVAVDHGAASEKIHICEPEEVDAGQHHEGIAEMGVREGSALELPGDFTAPGHDGGLHGDRHNGEIEEPLSSSSRYHSRSPSPGSRSQSNAGYP